MTKQTQQVLERNHDRFIVFRGGDRPKWFMASYGNFTNRLDQATFFPAKDRAQIEAMCAGKNWQYCTVEELAAIERAEKRRTALPASAMETGSIEDLLG